MSTSTVKPRRGLIRHWYVDVMAAVAAATVVVEIFNHSILGHYVLRFERDLLALLLEKAGLETMRFGYNTLLVYGWGHALTLELTPSCSGVYAATAFAISSLVVVNVPLRQRLAAVAVYAPTVFLANTVRMLVATALGVRSGLSAFHLFHDYVGSALFLLLFALLWLDWFYRSLATLSTTISTATGGCGGGGGAQCQAGQ